MYQQSDVNRRRFLSAAVAVIAGARLGAIGSRSTESVGTTFAKAVIDVDAVAAGRRT
jgi:hypothetical protein